jgi:O-antigen/teichoic acid export membrane protein
MTDILDTPDAGPLAVRGGALRVGSFLCGTLLAAGATVLLLRYLTVEAFGRYATVISLTTIVSGVTEAGLTNIGVREYSIRPSADRARVMANLLGLRLVATTLGIALALSFAYVADYSAAMIAGMILACLALELLVIQAQVQTPLQAGLRLGWVSLIELLRPALTVTLIVVLVLAGGSLVSLLAVPLPVYAVVLLASIPLSRGAVPLVPSFHRREWRSLLRIAGPYATVVAVNIIYVYVTVVLLELVASDYQVGLFGAAFRVFNNVYQIPLILVTSAFPILARAARDDFERLRYATGRLLETSLLVGLLFALAIVFSAPTVLDVLAGAAYSGAVPALRLQGIALVATFVATVAAYTLLSLERNRALVLTNIVALALTCGLTLGLGPIIGATGAAIANLAGELALIAGYGFALRMGAVPMRVFPASAPRLIFAAAVATGVGLILSAIPLAAAAAACTVFAILAYAVGAVPDEVLAAVRSHVPTSSRRA